MAYQIYTCSQNVVHEIEVCKVHPFPTLSSCVASNFSNASCFLIKPSISSTDEPKSLPERYTYLVKHKYHFVLAEWVLSIYLLVNKCVSLFAREMIQIQWMSADVDDQHQQKCTEFQSFLEQQDLCMYWPNSYTTEK